MLHSYGTKQDIGSRPDPRACAVWADHFGRLSLSKVGNEPQLQELECRVAELLSESYRNEEILLDTPFCAEEVADAVKMLKAGKAPGPDGLLAEHLKWGGDSVLVWLQGVLNSLWSLRLCQVS